MSDHPLHTLDGREIHINAEAGRSNMRRAEFVREVIDLGRARGLTDGELLTAMASLVDQVARKTLVPGPLTFRAPTGPEGCECEGEVTSLQCLLHRPRARMT
jgi:hypothetical protein